jgi:AcrR family transcriptional regulator
VGPLAARAAQQVRPRAALGRGKGLALGRRDGGDRGHLRGGRAPRRLPPRRPRRSTATDERQARGARPARPRDCFAQKGYHGTSIGEIAEALGVQKGSLYAHIESKQDCSTRRWRKGRAPFHAGLDAIDESLAGDREDPAALRSHLRVVADQLDVATVFVQEWRYLEGDRREEILVERRRYEERSARFPRGARTRRAAQRPR